MLLVVVAVAVVVVAVATPLRHCFHLVMGRFTFPSAQLQKKTKLAPDMWDASDFFFFFGIIW